MRSRISLSSSITTIPFWKAAEYSKLQRCRNLESIPALGNKDPGKVQRINRIKASDLWRKNSISLRLFLYTDLFSTYEKMFYGKMESRNEGIIFPARAGVILLLYMNFSTKWSLSRISGAQFKEAAALCRCLLNAAASFAIRVILRLRCGVPPRQTQTNKTLRDTLSA